MCKIGLVALCAFISISYAGDVRHTGNVSPVCKEIPGPLGSVVNISDPWTCAYLKRLETEAKQLKAENADLRAELEALRRQHR